YAVIDYSIDTTAESAAAPVVFTVTPDSEVFIGAVTVEGGERFGAGAIKRELDIHEGKVYRRRDIQESQRHLLRSGYYTSAQLRVLDSADINNGFDRLRPRFHVTVRESQAHYFNTRAGVLSDSLRDLVGELQVIVGKRNFLRTRRLEAQANGLFAFEGQVLLNHRYRLRFVEPWFLGIRMPLSLSGEYEPGIGSVLQPYRIQRWRFDAQTLWEIGRRQRIIFGWQYESVKIFDINPDELDVFREREGISVRRKIYVSVLRDTRDDIFVPRRGTVVDTKAEYYGDFLGGDANFFKLEASWSKYQPFIGSITRATRIKFGLAEPLGRADAVPSIDRFYIGGANGIRGFALQELPQPLDPGDVFSAGAEFYVIFNQELRFPLVGKLWGSTFLDAGNGWEGLDDPRISFDGGAYSYGMGVQYLSPAGPLRLDYARRIKTKGIANVAPRDDRFHFTILYAF
ncbi:MAG TPA: BamA/TamA family outer membrane protein, partial [candidate division Zixibacteria bacterium]|nr:BamA/TamA family outer membrane protein [candidate division Zixibacteria bacterium]